MLERSRARGAAFAHSTVRGPWGLRFDPVAGIAVHAVIEGGMYLWLDDPKDAQRLHPGDIVLVRGGLGHRMASTPGAACRPLREYMAEARVPGSPRRFAAGAGSEVFRARGLVAASEFERSPGRRSVSEFDTDAVACEFFCGAYRFDGDICERLLALLPDTMRLRPAAGSALRATVDLLARELPRDEPGQQALLDRLLDVALIQILREHFAAQGDAAPAWFRASSDPRIGPSLRAIHAAPERRWTVEALAAEALLSRAAFARRFNALLGVAPLEYVTGWRMALARERLRDRDEGIAAVAAALGYASEFSFAAAFKRRHGVAPGRWRTAARDERRLPRAQPEQLDARA